MLRLQQACGSTAILSSLLDAPTAITYTVHKLSSKRRKRWRRRWRGTWEARGSIVIRCDAPSTLFVCVCRCKSKQPKTKNKGQSTFSYLILFSSGTRLIAAEQYTVAHLLDADGRKAVTLSSNWRTDESVITKEKKIAALFEQQSLSFSSIPWAAPIFFFIFFFCCLGYFCLFFKPFVSFFRDIGNKSCHSFSFFDRRTAPQDTTQSSMQTTGMMEQAQVQ